MRDAIVLGALLGAFAAAVTFHLTLVVGLVRRPPRARGPIALLLPPLALYWGWREHMRVRSIGWVVSVALYVTARLVG